MKRFLLTILLLHLLGCSGFPVNDYDDDVIRTALNASLAQLNDQSRDVNLLRITRSRVKRVMYPRDSDVDFDLILEFSVRETICNKNSARDPSSCDFKIGYYKEASCRSQVLVSDGGPKVLSAYCYMPTDSSSESDSSEEIRISNTQRGFRQNSERFPSHWDPYGRMNQKPNPRWEEETWDSPLWE
ncbi:secreted phosphoprotein 24 [Spea bombifrons]|uniref:secreted phosphoprotein 24 n=1 Tax=Spea bombifrons TaxID=233779 RepID=UPI00234AAD60|nr:secreted phosphoprotein 24 [Spea bombifrons]